MTTTFLGARYFLQGAGHVIRPASTLDSDTLAKLPLGKLVSISAEASDFPKARQFYFGLIAILVRGGVWAHKDAADCELMVRAGRVSAMTIAADTIRYEPVSKAGWGVPEWREFLDQIVPLVLSDIAPGIPWRATRSEVERYCGVRLTDALNDGCAAAE